MDHAGSLGQPVILVKPQHIDHDCVARRRSWSGFYCLWTTDDEDALAAFEPAPLVPCRNAARSRPGCSSRTSRSGRNTPGGPSSAWPASSATGTTTATSWAAPTRGRRRTAFTPRELAGQRNAARRFLEGKKNSGTVAEIEQYQWYQDLVALASVATSNRGLGPACKLCKRKTTLKVTNNRGPHFGRKYYKCLPCAKWNSWAEPEPTLEDSAWEREDEAALAEAEAAALEALDAARDDATVDLTDEPADAST